MCIEKKIARKDGPAFCCHDFGARDGKTRRWWRGMIGEYNGWIFWMGVFAYDMCFVSEKRKKMNTYSRIMEWWKYFFRSYQKETFEFERIPRCFSLQLQRVQLLNIFIYNKRKRQSEKHRFDVPVFSGYINTVELFMNIYSSRFSKKKRTRGLN